MCFFHWAFIELEVAERIWAVAGVFNGMLEIADYLGWSIPGGFPGHCGFYMCGILPSTLALSAIVVCHWFFHLVWTDRETRFVVSLRSSQFQGQSYGPLLVFP